MSYIGDLGMQTASGIVGAGLGLALQRNQDQRQISQQQKLQNIQIKGQKEMTDYEMMKQLQMWKDTNYGPQMEQLKMAGLNPGLIYGMGGAGGATTGGPTKGVGAGHAPAGGGEAIHAAMAMSQIGLMRAQRDNLDADTQNKGAEKPLKEATTAGIVLNNEFLSKSMADRLEIINNEAHKSLEELDITIGKKEEERSTRMARIDQIRTDAANAALTSALIEAQTKMTGQNIESAKQHILQSTAEIKKWAAELANATKIIDRQERELALKTWEAGIKAKYPGMGQVIGRILNETANAIGQLGGTTQDTHNPPNTKKQ